MGTLRPRTNICTHSVQNSLPVHVLCNTHTVIHGQSSSLSQKADHFKTLRSEDSGGHRGHHGSPWAESLLLTWDCIRYTLSQKEERNTKEKHFIPKRWNYLKCGLTLLTQIKITRIGEFCFLSFSCPVWVEASKEEQMR